MEKTIKIDGKDVKFKATGGVLYRYKNQFGREYLADVMSLQEFNDTKTKKRVKGTGDKVKFVDEYDYTKLNLDVAYNLIWTLAKTADDSIPDPQAWLDSFDTFPVMEIFPKINELFALSTSTGETPKN